MPEKIHEFKFEGVDFWSRPVFKSTINDVRIGSLDVLHGDFPDNTPEGICDYFRSHTNELVIFGTSFDKEDPLGNAIKKDVNIKLLNP